MADIPVSGQRFVTDDTDPLNATEFQIRMALGRIWTSTLVQVQAVHSNGVGIGGTVDVLPMVNQIDSEGIATPHTTIYGLPFARIQGGSSGIVCDPVVNDIGVAVFASRDISSVKATSAPSNPGSYRRFDAADGVYLFSVLGGALQQYLQFLPNGAGFNFVDGNGNKIQSSSTGLVFTDLFGNVISMGSSGIHFTSNGVTVGATTHTHSDPQGGDTGAPNNGS